MMYCEDVFDLIDRIARAGKRPALNDVLDEFLRATGFAHVAYVAFNLPTGPDRRLLSAAFAPTWRKHHVQSGRVDLAPLFSAGLGGIAPLLWDGLERDHPIIRKLLGEALEFDLGANGVSVPLRGRDGEYALFSVCVENPEFPGMSGNAVTRRLMVASAIFHSKVRRACSQPPAPGDRLTDCELNCLRLRAVRKTDDEIGIALGASSNVARFWLETARARLNAVTVDAAVEKVLAMESIRRRAEADRLPAQSLPVTPSIGWRER